MLKYL